MRQGLSIAISFALPFIAAAAAPPSDFRGLVEIILNLIQIALPVLVSLALLSFFWGLAQFILHSGSEEAHEAGRNIMIWGIIALTVIVSVWGLVCVVGSAFGVRACGVGSSRYVPPPPSWP